MEKEGKKKKEQFPKRTKHIILSCKRVSNKNIHFEMILNVGIGEKRDSDLRNQ